MIHSPHDMISIIILASRYDTCTYRDTHFRLQIISTNCMLLILWWATKVLTILQSFLGMDHSHTCRLNVLFVKVS